MIYRAVKLVTTLRPNTGFFSRTPATPWRMLPAADVTTQAKPKSATWTRTRGGGRHPRTVFCPPLRPVDRPPAPFHRLMSGYLTEGHVCIICVSISWHNKSIT